MKAVSGEITSTNRTSLSNASTILSKFVSSEIGASQAIGAYLRRAAFAFNELNQLHKELNSPSEQKQKIHTFDEHYANRRTADLNNETSQLAVDYVEEKKDGSMKKEIRKAGGGEVAIEREVERGIDGERKKHKTMKNEDHKVEKKQKRKKIYEGGGIGSDENKSKKRKIKTERS